MDTKTKREFKDQLFEQFARIGRSLANGRRLEILELLAQRPHTVEGLARETGLSLANTSQHLQVLRRCNLVNVRREGLYAYYGVASDDVLQLCGSMRRLGETHLFEIQRLVESYLTSRETLEPVSCRELLRKLKEKNVYVLDVRPRSEYEAGHISGARSIPVSQLRARLQEIPKKREIVAYCRGPYCVFADEAVWILRKRGFRAVRLKDGFPEWKSQHLPVELGSSN